MADVKLKNLSKKVGRIRRGEVEIDDLQFIVEIRLRLDHSQSFNSDYIVTLKTPAGDTIPSKKIPNWYSIRKHILAQAYSLEVGISSIIARSRYYIVM